ncbi:MAG TPA: YebC/PmpR family DNA-binding transcriptional regulator [Myxococcota bacterium]|nr:YebC/PmpR family DNA-binding transcriptional regulator [Myxococcota bacterium]
MSGHSKWATIKRKKGAADAKRGKIFTQIIREISIAAGLGGGDPDANPRLRLAVQKARGVNMPKDNIERAIKKGTGELGGDNFEEVRYEGYGPGGAAVIVDATTDNRNRTGGEIRHIFSRFAGNLGATNSVAFMFERLGVLEFDRAAVDPDALMEAAIEANAKDVVEDPDTITVQTVPNEFAAVKEALEAKSFAAASAKLAMVPSSTVKLAGKEAQQMLKLYEALDEHEDVAEVFANFEVSDEDMEAAASA